MFSFPQERCDVAFYSRMIAADSAESAIFSTPPGGCEIYHPELCQFPPRETGSPKGLGEIHTGKVGMKYDVLQLLKRRGFPVTVVSVSVRLGGGYLAWWHFGQTIVDMTVKQVYPNSHP